MKNKGLLIGIGLLVVGLSVAIIVKAGGKKKGETPPQPTPPQPTPPTSDKKDVTTTTKTSDKKEETPNIKFRDTLYTPVEKIDFLSGKPMSEAPKRETFEERMAKRGIITKDLPQIQLPSIPKKIVVPMDGAKLRNSMTTLSKALKTYGKDANAIAVLEELENAIGVDWYKVRDGETIGFIRRNQVKPYSTS